MLPAKGRTGASPKWPLIPDIVMTARHAVAAAKVRSLEYEYEDKQTDEIERKLDAARERLAILKAQLAAQRKLEAALWSDLWHTPQAAAWERLDWTRDVAQYVRHKVLGELGELKDAQEARQWSDRLGLNPTAMLRLRWRVAPDEVAQRRAATKKAAPAKRAPSARDRMRAVPGGPGA